MACNIVELAEVIVKNHPESNLGKQLSVVLGKHGEVLGSEENTNTTDFVLDPTQLQKDALKSVDGMKRVLDLLNDKNVDKGYVKYIKGLLDQIDPQFIPDLSLYMNDMADKNAGMISETDLVINYNYNPLINTNEMTATEVYAHELIHAITRFATSDTSMEARKVVSQVKRLRDYAEANTSYKDLMSVNPADVKAEEQRAKDRWNYIFNSKSSIDEFIAHGMTNQRFMSKLKTLDASNADKEATSLYEQIANALSKLIDFVLGRTSLKVHSGSVKNELSQLTFMLMEANNTAINEINREIPISEKIGKVIDEVGNKNIAKFIDYIGEKLAGDKDTFPPSPINGSKVENALWAMRVLPRVLTDSRFAGIREGAMDALGMSPEGTINNILRDFTRPSDLERSVEKLGLLSEQVDRRRELLVNATKSTIYEEFNEVPTKEEEIAITKALLNTDLQSLTDRFKTGDIIRLLEDPEAIKTEIKRSKTRLKKLNPDHFNWNSTQAHGLGWFLATGKGNPAQMTNAENIARKVTGKEKRYATKETVNEIDVLASLVALSYTNNESKVIASKLFRKEKKGVENIFKLHAGIVKESRGKIFDSNVLMIKGYTKEIFDSSVEIKIRPLEEESELFAEGFRLVEEFEDVDRGEPLGIYRSYIGGEAKYNRSAVRLNSLVRRGTTLTNIAKNNSGMFSDIIAKTTIAEANQERAKIEEAMEAGTWVPGKDTKTLPLLDPYGNIVDFRYTMSRENKENLLKQDLTAVEVLGRTVGNITDKLETKEQNEAVISVLESDIKDNFDWESIDYTKDGKGYGKDGKAYVLLSKDHPDKSVRELYNMLPMAFKTFADKQPQSGTIPVRQDMYHNYFGFRNGTLTDFFGLHHITPVFIQKLIRMIETFWADIVSISKVDIIIRTPVVFIGNIISNTMYAIVTGNITDLPRILKMTFDNMKVVLEYTKQEQKIAELEVKARTTGKIPLALTRLKAEQAKSPAHELMQAGLYTAIVDDLNTQDRKSTNDLVNKFSGVTDVMPQFVKTGVNWLYLNENTKYFEVVTKATQMSDFVARLTAYQLGLEKAAKNAKTKQAKKDVYDKPVEENKIKQDLIWEVLDVYINYGKPASAFEEYLNQMGLIMFTKYGKRIQRAIIKSGKEKPVNIILSAIVQEAFMDVDDIWDQHPLVRSYASLDQSFMEHIQRAITPTALQAAGIMR